MNKPQHTPTPWENGGIDDSRYKYPPIICRKAPRYEIAQFHSKADRDRSIACVNACAGINPEAVPELFKLAEQWCNPQGLINIEDWTDDLKAALAKAKQS